MDLQTEQRFVIYMGQRLRASWRGVTLQLIIYGVFLTFVVIIHWSVFSLKLWIGGMIFLGSVGTLTATRGYGKTPLLIVDHCGFLIGLPLTVNRYLLPWSEIEAIYPANMGGSSRFNNKPCLSIRLRDIQRFRQSLNPLQRLFTRKKPGKTGTPINLTQIWFDPSIEQLLGQITERFSSELSMYDIQILQESQITAISYR